MASEEIPESFPWHLGVYDAHCHPTDTMSSIATIPGMKTRALTVMGTRGQDQSLVKDVADKHGFKSADAEKWTKDECMVPCFGWHPWFAHQMYITDEDEGDEEQPGTEEARKLQGEEKIAHYRKVLSVRPNPDDEELSILSSLPDPTSFSAFLAQTRIHLEQYPFALIGEVGLDKAFRVPVAWDTTTSSQRNETLTPGGREGRKLTPYRCKPEHQKALLKQQLRLAAHYNRAVSLHGVSAHGMLFDTLQSLWTGHEKPVLSKRERKHLDSATISRLEARPHAADAPPPPYPPRICLHSYSGDRSNLMRYLDRAIPVDVFASFSTAINLDDALDAQTPEAFAEIVRALPDRMVLVESDLHTAGPEMDRRMEDVVRRVCEVKGWALQEGVRILGANWRRFVFGTEA